MQRGVDPGHQRLRTSPAGGSIGSGTRGGTAMLVLANEGFERRGLRGAAVPVLDRELLQARIVGEQPPDDIAGVA